MGNAAAAHDGIATEIFGGVTIIMISEDRVQGI